MKASVKKTSAPVSIKAARRAKSAASTTGVAAGEQTLSLFETPLGWIGLVGEGGELVSVLAGHPSIKSVRAAATTAYGPVEDVDWDPDLRRRFESYADGEAVDFSHVAVRLPDMTQFQHQVIAATRKIGYGETASYGELARRAGFPKAARAVGTVMSNNRFPILIPCHRVLAAGGKLGGYSSPAGLCLKEQLLELEGTGIGTAVAKGPKERY